MLTILRLLKPGRRCDEYDPYREIAPFAPREPLGAQACESHRFGFVRTLLG
jgi:hypothetical protein